MVTLKGEDLAAAVDVWLPAWLWDQGLSRPAVRLHALLALYALQGLPAPGVPALAKQLRCTRGEVHQAMRALHQLPVRPAWMLNLEGAPAG